MVIRTVATIALYCPRCGKLQVNDISRFTIHNRFSRDLYCSCGQVQATLSNGHHHQYLLNIPCVVCQTNHIICLDSKKIWQAKNEKIYCAQENTELGFIGERQTIENTIASHKREFDNLSCELDNDEYMKNPQIMLEVLNKIHDIAETGGIYCSCGGGIEAAILPDSIELLCLQCGGRQVIPAQDEQDLIYVAKLENIELASQRCSHHK